MLFKYSASRAFLVLAICIVGISFALPNFLSKDQRQALPDWLQKTVSLGLDLQGGSHLQLEVDLATVNKEYLNTLVADVRKALRNNGIGYTKLTIEKKPKGQFLQVQLRENTKKIEAERLIQAIDKDLSITVSDSTLYATLTQEALDAREKTIIEQSIEIIRRRVDETGTKEPTIVRQGSNRIVLQLPGIDDPNEVKKRLGTTAKMTFHMVDESGSGPETMMLPYSRYESEGLGQQIAVKRHIAVNGDTLIDAQATTDPQTHEIGVSLKFNSVGARKFAEISANNIDKQFAIVLDGKVITAPVFRSAIPNGQASISGGFRSIKEANELALLLRAGSLPAPLKVVEERTIGPSLGADSITSGKNATLIAFAMVAVFMLLGYALFGVFANIALIFNVTLLFGALSILEATLTLPGIAGIAMAIGMAVDANVLIYERIKEELRAGTKAIFAIEAGYNRAMTTIIDANLTTLIASAALYQFGSGPIRGFAVTTALGIIISMFTALSVTKLLAAIWFRNKSPQTLPI